MALSSDKSAVQEKTDFIADLRRRIGQAALDITDFDFERYHSIYGKCETSRLFEQWETAKAKRAKRDLLAECTAPIDPLQDSTIQLLQRMNRLLVAILERLG